MTMNYHCCWQVAMHEASHIAVYLQIGGKWNAEKQVQIHPNFGCVSLGVLWDSKHGFLLDLCVYAAGIAADRIQGVPSCLSPGSDTDCLNELAIDFKFSKVETEMVIGRIEKWLRKYNLMIETTARELILARDKRGEIPKAKSRVIVKRLSEGLRQKRKLLKRKFAAHTYT